MKAFLEVLERLNALLIDSDHEIRFISNVLNALLEPDQYLMSGIGIKKEEHFYLRVIKKQDGERLKTYKKSWKEVKEEQSIIGKSILNKEIVILRPKSRYFGLTPLPDHEIVKDCKTCIISPFNTKSNILGCLIVFSSEKEYGNKEDKAILSRISEIISYKIMNLREEKRIGEVQGVLLDTDFIPKLFKYAQEGIAIQELLLNEESKPVNYRILYVNPQYESLLSLSKEEVIGTLATEAYCVEDPPYLNVYQQVVNNKSTAVFETFYPPMEKYFRVSVFWVGKNRFMTTFEDVTRRKRIEESLKENRRRMSTLLSNLPGIVYRCLNDEKWTMKYISEGCHTLTGYKPEELLGNTKISYSEIIHEKDRESVFRKVNNAIRSGEHFNLKYRIVTKDKTIKWVWERGKEITSQNNESFLEGFITDYSRQKRAENLEHQYKKELEREVQEKTEELHRLLKKKEDYIDMILKHSRFKTEFMSTMSHELRTPLNVVIGFTDLLLENSYGELNDKQFDFVKKIQSSAYHLLELINDILDISKIESGKIELNIQKIEIKRIITQLLSKIEPLYELKDLELSVIWEIDQSYLWADPIRLKEILYNLLDNAIKYTPEGEITLKIIEKGSEWRFEVIDTGIGITQEEQKHIFEDFKRGRSERVQNISGTGLGLSFAQRLIALHEGKIGVESTLGQGSTFYFTISKGIKDVKDKHKHKHEYENKNKH